MKYLLTAVICLFTLILFAQTARLVYPLADSRFVRKVSFSPDNKLLLSRTDICNVWNLESGKLLYTLDINLYSNAEFTGNGQFIVSYYGGNIVLLELKTGIKKIIPVKVNEKDFTYVNVKVSHGGKLIAVGNPYDSTLIVCSNFDKKSLKTYTGVIDQVLFTTDEKYMIARYKQTIRKWDMKSNQLVKAITIDESGWRTIISHDREVIAALGKDTISIWNFESDKPFRIIAGHKKNISDLVFSENSKAIIAYSKDSVALTWDIASGKLIKEIKYQPVNNSNISFATSADGKRKVVQIYSDSIIRLYDNTIGKVIDSIVINSKNWYPSDAFGISSDGNYISWGDDEQFYVYSTQKKEVTAFRTHTAKILDVILSPDNKYFLTNNHDRATLWDPLTAKPVVTMKSNRDGIECAFNEEGTRLLMWDGRDLELWSVPEGKKLKLIRNTRRDEIYKPFISNDGNKIGLVSSNEISIWKDSATNPVVIIKRVGSTIYFSPVFNKDGKFLLTANKDSVLLYLADSGSVLKSFKRSTLDSPYVYVYISPDDKYIMTHDVKHSQATVWDRISGNKLYNLNQNNPQFTNNAKFILSGQTVYDIATGKESESSESVILKYPLLNPFANKYITKFTNEDIIKKKMFQIKDVKTGNAYTMLLLGKNNYLVFDEHGRFDGTPEARNLLSVACGSKIMEQRLGLDKLWVPGLAEKIMKGETISGAKLAELTICK